MRNRFLRLFVAALAAGAAVPLHGQKPEPAPPSQATPPDPAEELLTRLRGATEKIQSARVKFTQTQQLKLLSDSLESKGILLYARDEKKEVRVRWEVTEPEKAVVLAADGMLTIYYPEIKEAERIPLSAAPAASRLIALPWTLGDAKEHFDIEAIWALDPTPENMGPGIRMPSPRPDGLRLTPKTKALHAILSSADLKIDREHWRVTECSWISPGGDTTTLVFGAPELDVKFPEDAFQLRLPEDVKVTTWQPPPRGMETPEPEKPVPPDAKPPSSPAGSPR